LTNGLQDVLAQDSICSDYDLVLIVDQAGLHASDLRAMESTSSLASLFKDAPSSMHVPYVRPSSEPSDILAQQLAQQCGSELVQVTAGEERPRVQKTGKHVVLVNVREQDSLHDHSTELANTMSRLATMFKRHLVLLSGSRPLAKRAEPINKPKLPTPPTPPPVLGFRYLTPPLVIGLLVTFGVFVPILLIALNALASVKGPTRVDTGKVPSMDKKNQ